MAKSMQHIYLPLLIGEFVDADGSATLRRLATAPSCVLPIATQGDAVKGRREARHHQP